MSMTTNRSRKTPKFVKKLNDILSDPKYSNIIAWLPESKALQIVNIQKFVKEVLPNYFRHKKMSSFVRQLNMYGFSRPKDSDRHVYFHPRFEKGNINGIRQIKKNAHEEFRNLEHSEESQSSYAIKVEQEQNQKKCRTRLYVKLELESRKLRSENKQQNPDQNHKLFNKKASSTTPSPVSTINAGEQALQFIEQTGEKIQKATLENKIINRDQNCNQNCNQNQNQNCNQNQNIGKAYQPEDPRIVQSFIFWWSYEDWNQRYGFFCGNLGESDRAFQNN